MPAPDPIRLIVTGHDEEGLACFTSDGPAEPITLSLLPGFETIELWTTTQPPSPPEETGQRGAPHYFPDAGGTVFRVVTFPPDSTGVLDPDFDFGAALAEAVTKVPDLVAKLEPDNPGFHRTDSVDYGVVIEGKIVLELDAGRTAELTPGCCVVQRGTRHAWRNPTDKPARMAFIIVGGTPPSA